MNTEKITIEGPGPLNPIAGKIDWSKPLRCKSGWTVKIYAIDHNLKKPVIGWCSCFPFETTEWNYNGVFDLKHPGEGLDLENVPEVAV